MVKKSEQEDEFVQFDRTFTYSNRVRKILRCINAGRTILHWVLMCLLQGVNAAKNGSMLFFPLLYESKSWAEEKT